MFTELYDFGFVLLNFFSMVAEPLDSKILKKSSASDSSLSSRSWKARAASSAFLRALIARVLLRSAMTEETFRLSRDIVQLS